MFGDGKMYVGKWHNGKRHGKGGVCGMTDLDTLVSTGMSYMRDKDKASIQMPMKMNTLDNSRPIILTEMVNAHCQRLMHSSAPREYGKIGFSKTVS